jgi:hypothetical protein
MSAAGSQAGSDAGDDDPSKLTRADVRALRRLAREAEQRRDREDRKDSERRKFWKTADVGYFWPDMPASYGPGRIVDYDGSRYFRDVNSFVTQLKDSMAYYTAEVVANNIQNCLKGQAFTWYSDILPAPTKRLLRLNTADECKEWTDMLLDAFKLSGSEAMKKISSDNTRYTMQMLKSGVSVVNWFTDMVSLAMDAEFGKDKQILRFIWFKMDAEMREKAPRMTDSHTIPGYLSELRNAEEGIREAVRAQDQRLAAEMRGAQWRAPQSRPYWNKTPTRPYGYGQTEQPQQQYVRPTNSSQQPTNPTPNREYTQYLPTAMKKLEIAGPSTPDPRSGSGANNMGKTRDWNNPRTNTAGDSKVLGMRRDNLRVNPRRNCRFCGGSHYDSMCRQRNLSTPRVYCFESDEVPVYIVQPRGDPEYDQEHQEFITAFFASGNTMDDFYRMCGTADDWVRDENDYIVECGLAEAEPSRLLKALPTTALHNATASMQGGHTRFADTTMRIPTPKGTTRGRDDLTIHQIEDSATHALHQCKRCPARFRRRNRLFAHLRTTNHYMAAEVYATPNDAGAERDPEVVKSTASQTFGTGYGFRTFNYLEMPVRLSKESEDTWVCLDTGAGMSLVDRKWLETACPDASILTRASNVSVRGIDNRTQKTSTYVVLQIFIPGHHKQDDAVKLAEVRREFHIVDDLRCKMIIGEDVIEPEGIVIDSQSRKASIKSCGEFAFKVRITPKGRQVLHRRVRSMNRVTVPPGSTALIPIKVKPLPENRDYEYTPVYDHHTAYLAEAGGFLRAVLNSHTEAVVFHNQSTNTVVVQKNLRIGYIDDFTAESYHACAAFDPEEHPALFEAAKVGTWKQGCLPREQEGKLLNDICAMPDRWRITIGPNGATEVLHGSEDWDENGDDSAVRLVDINSTDDITPAQRNAMQMIVRRFSLVFEDRGTVAIEPEEDHMRITLRPGVELPNKGPYNNSAKDQAVIDATFDKYHAEGKMGWSRPGQARSAHPAFVVWQTEKGRVVMDIRGLNAAVWKDPYPMPRQEDILQAMKGCHWLTTLDLTAAFMQRALHKDSQHLVTVVTHRGLEYFKVAPFGFTNSPAHMQRFMDGKLRSLRKSVRCYIDDIVIFSRTFEDHLMHLTAVLQILNDAGLYLSPKKCHLAYHSVKLLGRMVDRLGLSTLRERAEAVQKLQFPKTLHQLESFIGAANYNRSHVPYYAALIAPLEELKRELLRESPKKGPQRKRFTTKCSLDNPTKAQILSFEGVKNALSGPNTLIHFDNTIPLIIRMDASKERGYGAMITQIPVWSYPEDRKAGTVLDPTAEQYDHTLERPICFLSKRLNRHEMNYWPTELEVAGLVWTVRKVRHLVDDASQVVVFTDHQATRDIAKQTNFRHSTPHKQNLRLVRASLYLSQFPQIKILHIPGRLNVIPDALSRLQAADDTTDDDTDIYEALHLQASMLRISDDFIDRLQKGYNEDPFYKAKFSEMKRKYAKTGSLPVDYNNLLLEDAELHAFTPQAEGPILPGSRRYLLYLKESDRLRLCIPRSMVQPFLQLAHDRNNHAGFERTYQRLRQSYFLKGASGIIRDYIQHCPSCLVNKPINYTPSGRLIPITAPSSPWELVTMDLVVKLL